MFDMLERVICHFESFTISPGDHPVHPEYPEGEPWWPIAEEQKNNKKRKIGVVWCCNACDKICCSEFTCPITSPAHHILLLRLEQDYSHAAE